MIKLSTTENSYFQKVREFYEQKNRYLERVMGNSTHNNSALTNQAQISRNASPKSTRAEEILQNKIEESEKYLDTQALELVEVVKKRVDLDVYVKKKCLHIDFVKRLLEYVFKKQGWCAIHYAIFENNTIAVKYMLRM